MGMSHGQGGFGMGMYGGGSPPRNGGDGQMPITPLWQQQIAKADVSQRVGARERGLIN